MNAEFAFAVMESPAVLLFALFFFSGDSHADVVPLVFLSLWQLHYLNRTLIYPHRSSATSRRMPILILILAFAFNTLNAYINAYWIGHLGTYTSEWLAEPRFLLGGALFLTGWLGNVHSGRILRNLRKPGDTGYKIPRGGLYRWVSAANLVPRGVEAACVVRGTVCRLSVGEASADPVCVSDPRSSFTHQNKTAIES